MAHSTGTLLTTVSSRTDMSGAIRAAAVLFVTVLTAVAAQVSFPLPFTPVPFTLQPMIVLVGGAALGALLISTPIPVLKRLVGNFASFFKSGPGKSEYLELLGMMYAMFRLTQQSGVMALEAHCDDPVGSSILSK